MHISIKHIYTHANMCIVNNMSLKDRKIEQLFFKHTRDINYQNF